MNKTIDATFAAKFEASFPKAGEKIKTGKRGAPAKSDIAYVANKYKARLSDAQRVIAEENPFAALAVLQGYITPLTMDERDEVEESADAQFQAVDEETGHVIQRESRAGFEFSTVEDGRDLLETVVLPCAKAMAKRTGTVHFVRMERWAVSRDHRNGNGTTLDGRTSLFQHKMYVSDCPNKEGFLRFAIVHPSGRVEGLAKGLSSPAKASKAVAKAIATVKA